MAVSNARKSLENLRTEIAIRFDDPKEGRRVARTITDVEQLAGAMTEQLDALFDADPRARARALGKTGTRN